MLALDPELIIGRGEAVVLSFPAKPRITGASCEEVFEGLSWLHDGHLRRVLSDIEHPGILLALNAVEQAPQRRF